jgi:hypothetical protein
MGHPLLKSSSIAALATLSAMAGFAKIAAATQPETTSLRLAPAAVFAEPAETAWNAGFLTKVSSNNSLPEASGPEASGPIFHPKSPQNLLADNTTNSSLPTLTSLNDSPDDQSPLPSPRPTQGIGEPRPNSPHISFGRGSHATEGWQVLPEGLLYRSYLAGDKESRMQLLSVYDSVSERQLMDATLGARVGLLRNGSVGGDNPQGFQLDLDGAVFARVLPDEPSAMLEGSDYRAGLTGTWREDNTAWRLGYSHISSHIGDEFLLAYPSTPRLNYVRDSVLAGISQDLTESLRIYGEIAWAGGVSGGAKPLELQAGSEWTPEAKSRWSGAPFLAVHGHYREEQGSLIGVNTTGGWNWRGFRSGHRLKVGANYYHGPSLQFSFVDRRESLVGGGVWLDF